MKRVEYLVESKSRLLRGFWGLLGGDGKLEVQQSGDLYLRVKSAIYSAV